MKLIVGLGNPGREFAGSRHNVGFDCLNFFARWQGMRFGRQVCRARVSMGKVGEEEVVLAKPRVFINLSGEVVARLVRRFEVPLSELLIVYDDLDLPLGRIRLRARGGSGGHNGMKSIIAHLESEEFPRLRIGIAPPEGHPKLLRTPEYVLGKFSPTERAKLAEVLPQAAQAIYSFISEGVEAAMNKFNSPQV
ncbi:MAG: aminoacyl-tRNA hydrolase [Chloroflexi bacterium]|nr:MAG: aminoacyl-tRNA hydrolase [Chloroflexota bacterium]